MVGPRANELVQAAKRVLKQVGPKDREVLEAYIKVPNTPDCQPEMFSLRIRFGPRLATVIEIVENNRFILGVYHATFQRVILGVLNQSKR